MRIIKSSGSASKVATMSTSSSSSYQILVGLLLVAVCSVGLSLAATLRGGSGQQMGTQNHNLNQQRNYHQQLLRQQQEQQQLNQDQDPDEGSSISSPSASAATNSKEEANLDMVGTSEMGAVDPEFNDLTGDSSDTLDERAANDDNEDNADNSQSVDDSSMGLSPFNARAGSSASEDNGGPFGYQPSSGGASSLSSSSSFGSGSLNGEGTATIGYGPSSSSANGAANYDGDSEDTAGSNIANAKIRMSSADMATAAGHHHHHGHYPHGWLKMGAHTGKKGSFGWHDKHPVGGKGRR